jgi:hypothetical protein
MGFVPLGLSDPDALEWRALTVARLQEVARAERRAELDSDDELLSWTWDWSETLTAEYQEMTGEAIHATVPNDEEPPTSEEAWAIIDRVELERERVSPAALRKMSEVPRGRVMVVNHFAPRGRVMTVHRHVYRGTSDSCPTAFTVGHPRPRRDRRARGAGRPRGRRVISRSAGGGSSGDPDSSEPGEPAKHHVAQIAHRTTAA